MTNNEPTFACQECGKITQPKERHTYLDCLRHKFRCGRLTNKDTAALFQYAEKGEQAWDAERAANFAVLPVHFGPGGWCTNGWRPKRGGCTYTGGCYCSRRFGHPGRCRCEGCGSSTTTKPVELRGVSTGTEARGVPTTR